MPYAVKNSKDGSKIITEHQKYSETSKTYSKNNENHKMNKYKTMRKKYAKYDALSR
jgi:hypothetical protein